MSRRDSGMAWPGLACPRDPILPGNGGWDAAGWRRAGAGQAGGYRAIWLDVETWLNIDAIAAGSSPRSMQQTRSSTRSRASTTQNGQCTTLAASLGLQGVRVAAAAAVRPYRRAKDFFEANPVVQQACLARIHLRRRLGQVRHPSLLLDLPTNGHSQP